MAKELKTATLHRNAINSRERDEALSKLHTELYDILAEVIRVCDVLGLHPFLQGGSAIGAFFDKGIIPWDDDIDVGLIREEYRVFVDKAPYLIKKDFFVQCYETEPNMLMLSLLKVRRNNTFFMEEGWNDIPLHHGIFVDIMPYDKVPDNKSLQSVQRFLCRKLENAFSNKMLWKYWYKHKLVKDSRENLIYSIKACLWGTLFPRKLTYRLYNFTSALFNKSKCCTYYNQVKQKRDHIAIDSIDNLQKVPFGPLSAFVPDNVETYLRNHYPNLRPTIPENERESHMPERIKFSDGTVFRSMRKSPEISVIMPVYNGERYLRYAIDSILTQTFKDFELIIINDGSTDSSEQIILSYDDERIVYLKNEANLKLIATLNRGIEAARGEYIARIDADDRCLPTRFEKQINFLNANKDIALCGSWAYLIDSDGRRIGRIKNACSPRLLNCLLFFTCPLMHPSVMGRTSVFKQNKYDPDKLHIEDFELWNRLSRKGYNLANINEYLIEYRWHESNVSVKNSDVQYRAKCNLIKSQISELIGREPTPKEIALHEFSFRLYDKGHRCDAIHSVSELADEKNWLMELSAANDNAMRFGKSHFRAVLLSRWIVCCVAFGKYLQLLSLPPVFYTPDTLFKTAMLLIQK